MKITYKHITIEERDLIAIFRGQGRSLTEISKMIGRSKSTISRELRRNRSPIYNIYLPHQAHEWAKDRKHLSGKRPRLKNSTIRKYVITKLKLGWSPEQIAGRLS